MKKILFTILAFFYLSISSGATLHMHYCMDEMVNWSLTKSEKDNCEFCGMSKKESNKKSCCKDDVKQAKVDQSKISSELVYAYKPVDINTIDFLKVVISETTLVQNKVQYLYSNSPPDKVRVPIFIRNCTYQI